MNGDENFELEKNSWRLVQDDGSWFATEVKFTVGSQCPTCKTPMDFPVYALFSQVPDRSKPTLMSLVKAAQNIVNGVVLDERIVDLAFCTETCAVEFCLKHPDVT